MFRIFGCHNDVWKFASFYANDCFAGNRQETSRRQYISRKETSTIISCPSEDAARYDCVGVTSTSITHFLNRDSRISQLPTQNMIPLSLPKIWTNNRLGGRTEQAKRKEIQRRLNIQDSSELGILITTT
jgi:hypothetical protein